MSWLAAGILAREAQAGARAEQGQIGIPAVTSPGGNGLDLVKSPCPYQPRFQLWP